jgi:ribosomal-protein-alanine N-acetyltransferase
MAFAESFKKFPVLQTPRILLGELTAVDAEDYFRELRSALDLPNRPPWSFGMEDKSLDAVRASIKFTHNAWKKKSRLTWGLRLRTKKQPLIGCCTFFDFQNQAKAEVGFWLGSKHHAQGLMAEALHAALAHMFRSMGLHRVHAHTAVENKQSISMLKKVGFVQEGVLRQHARRGTDRWGDTAVMAILRDDFSPTAK